MKTQSKRLSILSLPEARELYSVPQFTARERQHFFSFTEEDLCIAKSKFHSHRNRIYFLLLHGYFKSKRVCLTFQWKQIEYDFNYLIERYYPSAKKERHTINRLTRSRIYKRVLQLNEYNRCDKNTNDQLLVQLSKRAKYYVDPAQLFHDCVAILMSKKVAIPGYSTLQKLISRAINTEETRISKQISDNVPNKELFLSLINSSEKSSELNRLKKMSKAYKTGENKKEMDRHRLLGELFEPALKAVSKAKLTDGNLRYFASRCQKYDIYDLRQLEASKALVYLVCFVVTRYRISNDILTMSMLTAYKTESDSMKLHKDERIIEHAHELAVHVELVPLILKLFVDRGITNEVNFGSVRSSAFKIISEDQIHLVIDKMEKVTPDRNYYTWEYIDTHFNKIITNIRPLFMALDFGCRGNATLEKHITSVKGALSQKTELPLIDSKLLLRGDRKYLLHQPEKDDAEYSKTILRRQEAYLYKLIYQGLRNGSVFVKNSLEYLSFDEYLVDDYTWNQRKKLMRDIGLSWMLESKDEHLESLESTLRDKLRAASERISRGENGYIKLSPSSDKLAWSRAVTAGDQEMTEKFFSHFIQRSIVNVIRRVNEETDFLHHLKPQSSRQKKSAASTEALMACLIANGTFQGTHKFSALSDQQYAVLNRIENDCFHDEAIQKAIDSITSHATTLPIFEDFHLKDGKIHSSADGQRFESKYGNPLVDYSSKHFGKRKGGIVYTLVTSHFATKGKVISARSHESHHLFDLVYNNASDLKAKIVSTDNHGINQFNHAILNTFGFQFTPRYARFKHRFLSEIKVNFNDGASLSLEKPINWKLIRTEWDNITKIMMSLGLRTVQQSTLVKKLCSFKQNNATMLALAEYNRVLKCLHLLDYADDKQLRQVIQESLNRGKQLQGLKRALAAIGGNQFRGRSPEEMARWNGCADLLANCMVYYNASIMSSYKRFCLDKGYEKSLNQLSSISPASWEHILLNGHYNLADNDEYWDIAEEIESLDLAV